MTVQLCLRSIIEIIRREHLCKNWDLEDEKTLHLYFEDYNVSLLYDDGHLFTIFSIHYPGKYGEELKKKLKEWGKIFLCDNKLYVQCKYKRFTKEILFDQIDIYNDILYYSKLFQQQDYCNSIFISHSSFTKYKKNSFYYNTQVGEFINPLREKGPRLSYPSPNILQL